MKKQILLWTIAIILTLASAVYQRMTGPTHSLKGKITFEGREISYKLERSHEGSDNHTVKIEVPDKTIDGYLVYKRYKSFDTLSTIKMRREENFLVSELPGQPAAGKIEYYIKITKGISFANIPEQSVIIRFKGFVPGIVLFPHILIIFLAMLFSMRAGLEALTKEPKLKSLAVWTFVLLFLGGMILGPIVQKYAFGAFWTGFPFGTDLTDNKTVVAFIGWIIAFIMVLKNKKPRVWVLIASTILLLVYLIPHSVMGSEIDYTKEQKKTEIGK
jgi:hypothetical protein